MLDVPIIMPSLEATATIDVDARTPIMSSERGVIPI